ncbi:MAG: type II secretion system F family protein [Planctomycetota bacterium]
MPAFRYKASTGSGEITTGVIDAADPASARLQLRRSELRVLAVKPAKRRKADSCVASGESLVDRWLRSRRSEPRAAFFDGLSTLLRSGLSLRRSLAVQGEGRRLSKAIKRLVNSLEREVAAGRAFEDAIGATPKWFDRLDAAVVHAGMQHGDLAEALSRLAARNRRSSELRTKVIAALSYPLLVLVVAVVVTGILSTRTLPPIVTMLGDADIAVPALTAGVMRVGTAIANPATIAFVFVGVLMIVGLAAAAPRLTKRTIAPAWFARRLPSFVAMPMLASLARSVADLTETGVPLAESLRVTEPTIRGPGASHLRETVLSIISRLEQGDDLQDAFDDGVWFDPAFHRLLAVGQDAGELPAMLRRLADSNDAEAKRAVDQLASLLEPAAILAMSGIVGVVVLAAVLPLIRLQEML